MEVYIFIGVEGKVYTHLVPCLYILWFVLFSLNSLEGVGRNKVQAFVVKFKRLICFV